MYSVCLFIIKCVYTVYINDFFPSNNCLTEDNFHNILYRTITVFCYMLFLLN